MRVSIGGSGNVHRACCGKHLEGGRRSLRGRRRREARAETSTVPSRRTFSLRNRSRPLLTRNDHQEALFCISLSIPTLDSRSSQGKLYNNGGKERLGRPRRPSKLTIFPFLPSVPFSPSSPTPLPPPFQDDHHATQSPFRISRRSLTSPDDGRPAGKFCSPVASFGRPCSFPSSFPG